MKLALRNRGKLVLSFVGPLMFILCYSLYLFFSKDAIEEAYDLVQVGMPIEETCSKLRESLHVDPTFGGGMVCVVHFKQPDSALIPGDSISVFFDFMNRRVTEKRINRPSNAEIWSHWKRQLWKTARMG